MKNTIEQLLDTMAQLRNPDGGCPWDIAQTFDSLATYTIEEAYEVVDCIDKRDFQHLQEELGDLLFQVVFYSRIAAEQGMFNFKDVVTGINEKMIKRHPHVFSDTQSNLSIQQQSKQWEQDKLDKRLNRDREKVSVLDDVSDNLPALSKAVKLTKRAAVIGFDWTSIDFVYDKMDEELTELRDAMQTGEDRKIKDELGDVLFVCANLARHLNCDPQLALRHANTKFEKRFRAVEKRIKEVCPNQSFFDLKTLENLWEQVKKLE